VMCLDPQLVLDRCSFVIHGPVIGHPGTRLEVVGSLDTRSTGGLLALAGGIDGEVEVDLDRCTFVDAAGVGGLVTLATSVRGRGGLCRITGARHGVERLLSLTGADRFLDTAEPTAS
jgi:anti-anti-sigma factor